MRRQQSARWKSTWEEAMTGSYQSTAQRPSFETVPAEYIACCQAIRCATQDYISQLWQGVSAWGQVDPNLREDKLVMVQALQALKCEDGIQVVLPHTATFADSQSCQVPRCQQL